MNWGLSAVQSNLQIWCDPYRSSNHTFFCKSRKLILQFLLRLQGFRLAKIILEKENKVGDIIFLDFKIYCTLIKTRGIGIKAQRSHWNRLNSLKFNAHITGQMMFTRTAGPSSEENSLASKSCWANNVHKQTN